jgi:septum site-determining protein MinC
MLQEAGITIKGTRDGLTVLVPSEIPLADVFSTLREKFQKESAFFQDASLILDLGPRPFQEEEFQSLQELFQNAGISIKGILSDNPITKLMAKERGIPLLGSPSIMHSRVRVDHPIKRDRLSLPQKPAVSSQAPKEMPKPVAAMSKGGQALFVRKTLRAGQKIHFAGDVAILGDVNPGAEVVAGGSIMVFGALRGMAHAGAEGLREAVVAAIVLAPTQLRIADCIARAPEGRGETKVLPEIAKIQDGVIVIEKHM